MAMDFLAPSQSEVTGSEGTYWKILIVDDDPDVHEVTKMAVAGCLFEGRSFELLHALSAERARELLTHHDDIAVALIDVVMESDTAGLGLVNWIRSEQENHFTRIILRTGQPGYAPQTDVIMKFDIDGYSEKAELSRAKLITAIVTALRGYKLVLSLDTNRRKLKQLNSYFASIIEKNALGDFASAVLQYLIDLVGMPVDCLLCGLENLPDQGSSDKSKIRILAAAGRFEDKVDLPIEMFSDDDVFRPVNECIETREVSRGAKGIALPLMTRNGLVGCLYLDLTEDALEAAVGSEIIQLFISNVALGYEKTSLLEHIRNLAYVDRITGLSTFSCFTETFDRNITKHAPLLVVHSEIQRFQVIVDGIGDEKAASILKKTGHRLSQIFPDALTITRKEKDEFLILLKGGEENTVEDVVARLEEAFLEPIKLDDNQLTLRLRLGFASAGDRTQSAEETVRFASIALNDVRQKGLTSYALFHPLMQEAALERLRLASLLTGSSNQTEFSLRYQPIMRGNDETVASFEALMRFRAANGEFLNTARMIEAAEASGSIIEIGAWMFKTAFADFARMPGLSGDVRLNVNLSPRQVQSNRIYKDIEDAAGAANLSLNRLVFEVTEGLFISNDKVTISLLTWLRSKGAKVVIDDFGTGYSSFGYLRKLPVDGIKIDRAFIMNMDQDPDALAVVKSMIAVAKALDLNVTAEGVETAAQKQIMQELQCDYLQGYLYAEPLDRTRVTEFIRNTGASTI